MSHLEWVGPVAGVQQTVPAVVGHGEPGPEVKSVFFFTIFSIVILPEVCPEDGLVVRGVDVLVLVLDVGDADPVALGGAGHVAVHQLVHFLGPGIVSRSSLSLSQVTNELDFLS